MVEPVTVTMAGTAAIKIFSNIVDDLYSFLKTNAQNTINKRNVINRLPMLLSRMQNVRLVKTLWQVDTAVDVESFYCASHVLTPRTKRGKRYRRRVDNLSDFGEKRKIVVKGITGQGKSIFLRHLCIKEFEAGKRIPVFIELRKILKDETIFTHISQCLDILDLPINKKLFRVLLQSGKFAFFLYGFDEVQEEHKQQILNELENLSASSGNTPFTITTRPNTAIEMSPYFDVFTLDDLKGAEYKAVIYKLTNTRIYANTLIKAISSNAEVLQLLCNPLLITLLIISYKSYQQLPEKLSDFYDMIFLVLLRRHDGTKPGFTRLRQCEINDNQYREIFDTLCFESKKVSKPFFDNRDMYELIKESIKRINLTEDAAHYLEDIINVTCLILHEGEEYRFIHKSVQEYYAASFIKNRPDNLSKKFYDICLSDYRTSRKWGQELHFLSEIDRYRYSKYYLLPLCRSWLNVDNDSDLTNSRPAITDKLIKHTVGSCILGLDSNIKGRLRSYQTNTVNQILSNEEDYLQLMDLDYENLFSEIENKTISVDEELLKDNYYRSSKNWSELDDDYTYIAVEQVKKEGYMLMKSQH